MLGALNGGRVVRRLPLRGYQVDGVDSTEKAWEEVDRVLGCAATGSGKSLLCGELIARRVEKGERCLMLAHQRKLVSQFAQVTERDFGIWSTVEMGDQRAEDSPLVCASVQTLVNRIRKGRFKPDEFSLVIWDESHHSLSATHQEIAKAFPHAKHLGVTATPMASGRRDLMKWFEAKSFDIKLDWLIENGHLARLENLNIPITIRVKSDAKSGDFTDEEAGAAIEPYLEACADWLATAPEAKGRCSLVFQPLRATSRKFVELLLERGVKAAHIDGTMNDDERASILKRFLKGDIHVLSNALLLTEGVDLPPVNLVMNLRCTRSWVLWVQMIGRGTRLYDPAKNGIKGSSWPAKEACLIVDPLWLCDDPDMNPMRLPNLLAKDDEEADAIKKVMDRQMKGGGKADLMEAVSTVKAEREETLRKRLEAMAKRKSRTVDAVEFFSRNHRMDCAEYEPMSEWELSPITPKQREILERNKFSLETIHGRGHASKILDVLFERTRKGLCTTAQARFAESLGAENAYDMTFEQAKAYLDANAPAKGKTPYWKR